MSELEMVVYFSCAARACRLSIFGGGTFEILRYQQANEKEVN
jgi:hypothetical protein